MRNLGAGLAIPDFPLSYGRLIPPGWTPGIAVNFAHRSGAIAVAIMVTWTVVRVARNHRGQPLLMHPALGLLALLALQIALGALTIWSGRAVLPTTAHVAIGAAVLATAFALTIRAFRLTRVGHVSEPIPAREPYRPARAMAGSRVAS
jgi:cytochrome c oxidase assembly protein subunit 15